MAVLIARADGNFTAAATWGLVDPTSYLDAENQTTNTTTTYQESQPFTPGAITVDGLAVKVHLFNQNPQTAAGTITVRLAQAGALVAGTEVTTNLNNFTEIFHTDEQPWIFFKFAAPVTLTAATAYTLSVKTSVNSVMALRRVNTNIADWSRMLRTTTPQAPAAGDKMFVLGEWTGLTTKDDRTLTMDNTAATDFGDGNTSIAVFGVSKGGIVTWATAAATNYQLRLSGKLHIYQGGVWTMGSIATPCPRTSSMLLEFDCLADGDFGVRCFGTWTSVGQSRSSGKDVVQCLLNTDEPAGQTVLGVDTDTGWLNGDDIGIASTTRTATQNERRTLAGDATTATMTVSVALTNAHDGTAPAQAEVILLTRNVRVQSVNASFVTYVCWHPFAHFTAHWTSFRRMASNAAFKYGFTIQGNQGAVGALNLTYCSFWDFEDGGIIIGTEITTALTVTISHCMFYGVLTQFWSSISTTQANDLTAWSLNNLTFIGCTTPGWTRATVWLGDYRLAQFANIRVVGCNDVGIHLAVSTTPHQIQGRPVVRWTNLITHSNAMAGIGVLAVEGLYIDGLKSWRNAQQGVALGSSVNATFKNCEFFGNTTTNVEKAYGGSMEIRFLNCTFSGDSTFATTYGFLNGFSNLYLRLRFEGCSFGVVSGIRRAHTGSDVNYGNGTNQWFDVTYLNTVLASAVEEGNTGGLLEQSVRRYQRADGATNIHKVVTAYGRLERDTTTFRTAAPSLKCSPTAAHAMRPLIAPFPPGGWGWQIPILSGGTRTFSLYVRKDGTYNGQQPRLMIRANSAIGITDDTQIAVMSGGANAWELLSGAIPAATEDGVADVYLELTGSAGAVYLDDVSVV